MKKLMITAAALLTACVVGAATDRERASGTDFESYPLGALSLDYDEDGLSQGTYWSSDQLGESEVKEESEGGNKFLAIDETVPLYRNMFKSNLEKKSETVDAEQSVYFSSKVKFTASEDETITPSEGDKLIVWLRATEGENPATNLIVTAYNGGAYDYVIDNKQVNTEELYLLDIVASADGELVKFTVSVGGTVLSSGGVTEFQSLVRSGSEKATITCAGFKGSGWVDDIEFGTIEENPTKYYEVDGEECITFAEALEAAASAEDPTIKLINNAVLEFDSVGDAGYYNEEDTIIIDLNGHSITCEGTVFLNDGDMTIVDSVGGGSVVNTLAEDDDTEYSIVSSGSLIITGGKFMGEVLNDGGELEVTLNGAPAELVLDEDSESDTCGYYIIKASGESPANVAQIPTAASNLTYDGTEQTGVAAGKGYTLTGTAAATNAGDYTATATLEEGYIWSDESTEAKTINWSIAKAQVTATVSLTETSATYDSEKDEVTDYTTPSVSFGLGAPELEENTDYTVAWSATEVTGAGTFTYTVSPVANSNYTFTEASATLTITEGGEEAWPTGTDLDELEGKKVQDVYTGISADFDKVDAKTFVTWASGNGGVAYADKGTTTFNIDCFLLNIANNSSAEQIAAATTTAAEAIKITAITFDEDGKPVITAAERYGNGVVVIEGTISLEDIEWHAKADGDHFFRTKLVVDEVEDPQP